MNNDDKIRELNEAIEKLTKERDLLEAKEKSKAAEKFLEYFPKAFVTVDISNKNRFAIISVLNLNSINVL